MAERQQDKTDGNGDTSTAENEIIEGNGDNNVAESLIENYGTPVVENEITDGNGTMMFNRCSIAVPGNSSVTVPITVISYFTKARSKGSNARKSLCKRSEILTASPMKNTE